MASINQKRARVANAIRHHPDDHQAIAAARRDLTADVMTRDLVDWASRAATELPPLVQGEVAAVAQLAAKIDQRLAAQPGQEAGAA